MLRHVGACLEPSIKPTESHIMTQRVQTETGYVVL